MILCQLLSKKWWKGLPSQGKLCVVFKYQEQWGPGSKFNFSPYYPDKATAASAILQWAGPKWSERVHLSAFTSQPHLAPSCKDVDMKAPLTKEEREVLHQAYFLEKLSKNKNKWVISNTILVLGLRTNSRCQEGTLADSKQPGPFTSGQDQTGYRGSTKKPLFTSACGGREQCCQRSAN